MTEITKYQFKVTIPTIISVVISIITSTFFISNWLFNYKNELKSEVVQLKSNFEILSIQQKNGFQTINNARKRDSAFTVNALNDIKNQNKEMMQVFLRSASYNRSLTGN